MGELVELLRRQSFAFALVLALVLLTVNVIIDPTFADTGTIPATLGALAPFVLVSMASSPAVLSGGIDLSVGPLLSLANVVMVTALLPAGLGSPWLSIPIILALGAFVGAANGMLVTVLRFPPVIATLCSLFVLLGVAETMAPTPESAPENWTGDLADMVGPLPGALLIMAVPVLAWIALNRTTFRRALYAVGDDDVSAFTAGVNVTATRIIAYALGGMIAALAGLALTGVIHSGDSSLGLEYTLIALAAVVLGGTPLGGGQGGLAGAFFGAASLFLVQNLVDELNVNPTWLQVVYGGVLIVAALLSTQLARGPQAARSGP